MTFGLVIYGSLEQLTGGYLYDKILVDYLRGKGHRVKIFSLRSRSYGLKLLDNFSHALYRQLTAESLDVLIEDELNHPSLFRLNEELKKKQDLPIVSVVHQVLCRQPRAASRNVFYRYFESRFLNSVDGLVFNSHSTQTAVQELLQTPKPCIVAHPAGDRLGGLDDEEKIRERTFQRGPLQLLFLGNVLPNKGLHLLIEQLSAVPKTHWQLVVVGSMGMHPAYVKRVRLLIKERRVSDNVLFRGSLQGQDLRSVLQHSHVLAMPFSHEGYGIAYVEGMAFGLPAIGSESGAAGEIIRHEENGFLIPCERPEELGRIIRRLYSDRDLLFRMSLAARQRFEAHPTWAMSMEKIYRFLLEIAKGQ